ncbi:ferredoxin [Actinoplanes italicus]|uniref:Ferredoxin-NADP reductase n=1 Tax=Actinoplanes italicus TaxID=113567 RepID=A0A2T0KF42_9ACTN|nr:PDR/VanB family oxidoreductase [Actinoplanes italicus]PRX21987.1 ferredoxin-NADP reductase [Actinoplanes italicus]GIE29595.1 ferredoxin [Actinoplanes italicus]
MTNLHPVRVSERIPVAEDVVALELRHPDGRPLPAWSPGAHVDVLLSPGLTRQYSLCGDPRDRSVWRIAVRLQPGGRGGSQHVHDRLSASDVIEVSEPRNHFELLPAARYLFIAGGIGITPILPMLGAAREAGARWELHYAGRTAASMPFREQLLTDYGSRVTLYPEDERGRIDLDLLIGMNPPDTMIYCCGPSGMLEAVEACCAWWPGRRLHVERFTPVERDSAADDREFEVELARSGRTLRVPADRSILEAVEEAGVGVLSSCREGTCGTCETTVLEGRVDHRDSLLTADERAANDTIFLCVSRAADNRLVIDL